MRIAISGAAGTGKTILAQELAKKLEFELIPEGVREYLEYKKIEKFRGMSPKETMGMQWSLLNSKIGKEKNLENFVADRSPADNVCYALRWCARETQDVPKSEMKHYIEVAKKHCETYDLIFFLPTGVIPLDDDGLRSSNENYQYEMNCLIKGILLDWRCPFTIIRSIGLKERLEECQDKIDALHRAEYGVYG